MLLVMFKHGQKGKDFFWNLRNINPKMLLSYLEYVSQDVDHFFYFRLLFS